MSINGYTVCVKRMLPYSVVNRLPNQKLCLFAILILVAKITMSTPVLAGTTLVNQVKGFYSPTRVALARSGDIYVSDSERGVVVIFDSAGLRTGMITGLGVPLGLAIWENINNKNEKSPSIFVGDEEDGSVRVFVNGETRGVLGNGKGEFIKPNGIALTQSQMIYVVDSKADQVKVYNEDRILQFVFGATGSGDGQFNFPTDLVVNETTGEVYVADFMNKRIAVFDLAGNWLRNILPPLNDAGDPVFFRPSGLGMDPSGNLYVVDNALSCVAIINSNGALIDAIGYRNGQYWTGEIDLPVDAAADGRRIYVTSNRQKLLVIFEVVP